MELQRKDVVLIEVKKSLRSDTCLETVIGKCSDTKECLTQSFGIFKELDVKPLSFDFDGTCKLLKAWRLDPKTDNYVRVYPERDEESTKPAADVSKVLQENAELKEIVVGQAKEIHDLKKGN